MIDVPSLETLDGKLRDYGDPADSDLETVRTWSIPHRKAVITFARAVLVAQTEPVPVDMPERWPAAFIGAIVAADHMLRRTPERARKLAEMAETTPRPQGSQQGKGFGPR